MQIEKNVLAGEFEVDKNSGGFRVQMVFQFSDSRRVEPSPIRWLSLDPAPATISLPKPPTTNPVAPPIRLGTEPRMVGFMIGSNFTDIGPAKSVLIGLELGLNKAGDREIVRSVRPIYRVGDKEIYGDKRGMETGRTVTLKAKRGYAIGALNALTGLHIDGVSVTFMKVRDGKIDPKDSYESDWVGREGERPNGKIEGDGSTVIGIAGKIDDPGANLVAFGIVYKSQFEAGTQILGGVFDPEFQEAGPEGYLLVGFEVGLGKFFDNDVVRAIRPVYRKGEKQEVGAQRGTELDRVVKVIAKPGYAVGAVTIKAGSGVDGMSVTFMKLIDGKLDPKDAYESEWIGGKGGGGPDKLARGDRPIVGIVGKANAETGALTGLGLLPKGHD